MKNVKKTEFIFNLLRFNFQTLFSDEFEDELKQRFPLLNERGRQHQLEQKVLSIYSQMYRHYLKHKNFDDYQLPELVGIKATE